MVTESGEASLTTPVADADVVARTDGRVAVIGLGYVGPAAGDRVRRGRPARSRPSTPNRLRVAELSRRRSPIDDISDERLGAALDAGLRVVGADDGRLGDADAVFVCVPDADHGRPRTRTSGRSCAPPRYIARATSARAS